MAISGELGNRGSEESLTTGINILDTESNSKEENIGGIKKGSTVTIYSTRPSEIELMINHLVTTERPTYYMSFIREEEHVREDLMEFAREEEEEQVKEMEFIKITRENFREDIEEELERIKEKHDPEEGSIESPNIIINSFEPVAELENKELIEFTNKIESITRKVEGLTYLYFGESNIPNPKKNYINEIVDGIFTAKSTVDYQDARILLAIRKLRGTKLPQKGITVQVRENGLKIETTTT